MIAVAAVRQRRAAAARARLCRGRAEESCFTGDITFGASAGQDPAGAQEGPATREHQEKTRFLTRPWSHTGQPPLLQRRDEALLGPVTPHPGSRGRDSPFGGQVAHGHVLQP